VTTENVIPRTLAAHLRAWAELRPTLQTNHCLILRQAADELERLAPEPPETLVALTRKLVEEVEGDHCREGHRRDCAVWQGRKCDCYTGKLLRSLKQVMETL
jgi:hypothetical protein